MRLAVPKKALLALGGAATSSVGTWKLYEEADPNIDTLLNRQGFYYSPIEADLRPEGILDISVTTQSFKEFNFNHGPSVRRLLPSLEEVSDDWDSNANHQNNLDENFYQGFEASQASFIADIKHWPPGDKQKNGGIAVKLELVIKNKSDNKALVIQNVISNLVDQRTNFVIRYRYFLVAKEGTSWKIKEGYAGVDSWLFTGSNTTSEYLFTGFPGLNLEIDQNKFCARAVGQANKELCKDLKAKQPSSYRYSALWQPDPSSNQTLFEPIKVISKGTEVLSGSIWGNKELKEGIHFDSTYKDKKWSSYSSESEKTKKLFTPLILDEKNKKGKWVSLEDFCSSWSSRRGDKDSSQWRDYCYKK